MPDDNVTEATTDDVIRRVLTAAADLQGFEVGYPERIHVLQATPDQWMVRVEDRDGHVHGLVLDLD